MKQFFKLFGVVGLWFLLIGAIIQSGVTTDLLTIDPTRKAARVTTEPNESLGHYSASDHTVTGIATAGAGAEIFQFRNSTTTKVAIERITIQMVLVAAITTGQELSVELDRVIAWTGQGTGGNVVSTAFAERRDSMPVSAMLSGDIRVASTAALGAGTKSILVAEYRCGFQMNAFTVGNMSQICEIETRDNKYPLFVFDQNEGFIIRNVIALATGTGKWIVNVQWREVSTY